MASIFKLDKFINFNTVKSTCSCCTNAGKKLCTNLLIPCAVSSSKFVKQEFIRIHRNQNWFKRCGMTLSGNAIGLMMAISSAKIVEYFVEKREINNLWGLLASRPTVSDTTFEILCFLAEFLVALIVFTLTEHYLTSLRNRQTNTNEVEVES